MAEISLASGLVIDVASGDDIDGAAEKILGGIKHHGEGKPLYLSRFAAAMTPAAGTSTTVLGLGRPRAGRIWNLVYLTVTGGDDRTPVAGATVASYVGDPDQPTLHGLIDPANGSSVPASSNFGEKEIWVHDDEHLFLVVYGAPNSQQLAAVARVLDYAADDREASKI